MSHASEWRFDICKDLAGQVTVSLYEVTVDDQWSFLDAERFGPFDTATDVAMWLIRHWSPRARLPLR